jgi:hypothetical protein
MTAATEDEARRRHLAACRACRILHDYAQGKNDALLLEAAGRQLSDHVRYERTIRARRHWRDPKPEPS